MAKIVKVKKLNEEAVIPEYAFATDAGMDLKSIEDYVLMPNSIEMINTGLAVAIPEKFFGGVYSKSGLASKGVIVANAPGVVDSQYRGEVKVLLYNTTKMPYEIKSGDKIAQLILMPFEQIKFREADELDETDRKDGGFGSTGK